MNTVSTKVSLIHVNIAGQQCYGLQCKDCHLKMMSRPEGKCKSQKLNKY